MPKAAVSREVKAQISKSIKDDGVPSPSGRGAGRPEIIHSDQGSEYKARLYTGLAEGLGIKPSMNREGSPWENGYQESFYSQFKVDLADVNRYKTVAELAVAIYLQIHYYNHKRIHTELKMPPAVYAQAVRLLTTRAYSKNNFKRSA